jgi:hypothetical protein
MKKACLLFALLLTGCTVYTEKQSEALSQNVYATSDSLNVARVDLAYYYSDQSTRLVKPPKKRIDIQSIYNTGNTADIDTKTRVVLIPEQYKNDKVVAVNTTEYQMLLKDKTIAEQLKKDNANLLKARTNTDQEIIKQKKFSDKMINDLNTMQKKLIQKDLTILKLTIALIALIGIIGVYIYLRIKGLAIF